MREQFRIVKGAVGQSTADLPSPDWRDRWISRAQEYTGRILNALRVPGMVSHTVYDDPLTGEHIEVTITALFTVFSISGRDYYFRRIGGRFDGTGMGCR